MAAAPDLVSLFYYADWTRLSLTARVTGMVDFAALARQADAANPTPFPAPAAHLADMGIRRFAGTLRLSPAGRYEVDISEPTDPFPENGFHSKRGNAPPDRPPYPDLLRPSRLLSGFDLDVRGEVALGPSGRSALSVVATRRPGVQKSLMARPEWIEVTADAETGILLRSEETFDGRILRVTELTDVVFGEPGEPYVAPESHQHDSGGFTGPTGPGWTAAKTAINVAGTVLGSVVGHAPRRGSEDDPDPEAAMPVVDEPPEEESTAVPVTAELLRALYRSGRAEFAGTLHQWADIRAMAESARSKASEHSWSGAGSAVAALGDRLGVSHRVSRVRTGGAGRYRVEHVRPGRKDGPNVVTCDGMQLWREYGDRFVIGPAAPLDREVAQLTDTSSLLESGVTNIRETVVAGRRAFVLRAGPAMVAWGDLRSPDSELVIDAELGIVLRLVRRTNGKPTVRYEFRDVTARTADDGEFRVEVPAGVRVVRTDGTMLDDLTATLPEPVRLAAKAAGGGLRAARGVVNFVSDRWAAGQAAAGQAAAGQGATPRDEPGRGRRE